MEWLKENIGSIIILLVLIAILTLIIVYIVRSKLKGKHPSCGGNCNCCSMGCAHCSAKNAVTADSSDRAETQIENSDNENLKEYSDVSSDDDKNAQ